MERSRNTNILHWSLTPTLSIASCLRSQNSPHLQTPHARIKSWRQIYCVYQRLIHTSERYRRRSPTQARRSSTIQRLLHNARGSAPESFGHICVSSQQDSTNTRENCRCSEGGCSSAPASCTSAHCNCSEGGRSIAPT